MYFLAIIKPKDFQYKGTGFISQYIHAEVDPTDISCGNCFSFCLSGTE